MLKTIAAAVAVLLLSAAAGRADAPPTGDVTMALQHSGLCLVRGFHGIDETSVLAQYTCDGALRLTLAPHGDFFTIEVHSRFAGPGAIPECATVARGVVFGPASIDLHTCEGVTGAADQRFRLVQAGTGWWEVHTPNGQCWDLQDQSRLVWANVIQWACNGQRNQHFAINVLPVPYDPGMSTDPTPQPSPDQPQTGNAPPSQPQPGRTPASGSSVTAHPPATRPPPPIAMQVPHTGVAPGWLWRDEADIVYGDRDLGVLQGLTLDDCKRHCRAPDSVAAPKCAAISWLPPASGTPSTCRLKTAHTAPLITKRPGARSAYWASGSP
jgi:hypothetical protein